VIKAHIGARCSTPMVDLHCILEWKLVHSKEQFAERNNPEGVVRVDSECNFNATIWWLPFARMVENMHLKHS
jgi:hypothetical protein